MNLLLITTIISVAANIILGVFVLLKKYKNTTNILFSLFCLFVAIWSILTYFSIELTDKSSLLLMMRLVMAFATAQSITILLFILSFLKKNININKWVNYIIIFLGLLTFGLCLTPFIFSDIDLTRGGQLPVVGSGILLFTLVTIGSILLSIFLLIREFLKSTGILKTQLAFIMLGTSLMYLGVLYFSFIKVVVFENSNFVYLSSLFTLPFIVFTSYAILRYRFMDIRVIIRKSIVYIFSFIVIIVLYLLVLSQLEIENIDSVFKVILFLVLIVLGIPTLNKIVNKFIQYIFQGKVNIDLAVKEVRDKLSKKNNLNNLIDIIMSEIGKYLSINEIKIFVINKKDQKYFFKEEAVTNDSNLIKYFTSNNKFIIKDEIPYLHKGDEEISLLKIISSETKFKIIIPLISDQELIGFIILNDKKNKNAYSIEDVKYLEKIKEQITSAIANALLYQNAMKRIQGERE